GAHPGRGVRAGKTGPITPNRIPDWLHLKPAPGRTASGRTCSRAFNGTETRDPCLRSNQSLRGSPGKRLIFQGKADLQRDLPVIDFAVFDMAASFGHFKPAHVTHGPFCAG